jgi:hypothetical protein
LLELMLFRTIPRRDTKPLAKALLAKFGDLAAVRSALRTTVPAGGRGTADPSRSPMRRSSAAASFCNVLNDGLPWPRSIWLSRPVLIPACPASSLTVNRPARWERMAAPSRAVASSPVATAAGFPVCSTPMRST